MTTATDTVQSTVLATFYIYGFAGADNAQIDVVREATFSGTGHAVIENGEVIERYVRSEDALTYALHLAGWHNTIR